MFDKPCFEPTTEQLKHIADATDRAAREIGLKVIEANDALGKSYLYCYGLGGANE